MKLVFTFILLAGFVSAGFSQPHSCCMPSSGGPSDPTVQFASFSVKETFRMNHDEPLPFTDETPSKGKSVQFPAGTGKPGMGYFIPAPVKTRTTLFVFHEWWGLNDYIRKEAEQFAAELGINVLAIDLYDGKVAVTRDSAAAYMGSVKTERARDIILGALEFSGKEARILTTGWCFGGGWSLQAGLLAGKQAAGSVIYYGMPESDPEKLKNLNADVLGIFAGKDQWITHDVISGFEKAMASAGKKVTVYWYEADHAFANPSNPRYQKEFAADARKKVIEFFKARL
ncbi:MAG: dienelactone hydrolase family protein [Bacteroidetes bacterium]|nr:dienelactone hydrolase family protein [Bacteroidota bacterium]